MWNVKAKLIPVIIGATGTVSKSLRQYLSNISGKDETKERQKIAILGTAQILRGRANVQVQNIFSMGNNITCSANCNYRTAATLCTVETWFVAGTYCKYPA